MSERIDHAAEAAANLGAVGTVLPYTGDQSAMTISVAQVHATLALVEQQRIANLIALHRHEVRYDIGEWSRLYDEGTEDLKADIREALGTS